MLKTFTYIFLLIFVCSCSINYTFTGASISPDVKTVSIDFFTNQATMFQPTVSQVFTEGLKDRLTSQTRLVLTNNEGDIHFEGAITNYVTNPIAIQANETAAMNRLSITVRVKFTNNKDNKQSFEQTFSQFEDYSSSSSLTAVEDELIKQIVDKLTEDIFNRALANW